MHHIESPEAQELVSAIFAACCEGRADLAEADWQRLQALGPLPELTKVIPAYIMIARGDNMDALRHVNELPEDLSPATRALCLRMAGDPTWRSLAESLVEDADPLVREGVGKLLSLR